MTSLRARGAKADFIDVPLVSVPQVTRDHHGYPAGLTDVLCRLGELVVRPCHQANRGPGAGQADRDSPADAAAGPVTSAVLPSSEVLMRG